MHTYTEFSYFYFDSSTPLKIAVIARTVFPSASSFPRCCRAFKSSQVDRDASWLLKRHTRIHVVVHTLLVSWSSRSILYVCEGTATYLRIQSFLVPAPPPSDCQSGGAHVRFNHASSGSNYRVSYNAAKLVSSPCRQLLRTAEVVIYHRPLKTGDIIKEYKEHNTVQLDINRKIWYPEEKKLWAVL